MKQMCGSTGTPADEEDLEGYDNVTVVAANCERSVSELGARGEVAHGMASRAAAGK